MKHSLMIVWALMGISGSGHADNSNDFRIYTVQDGDTCWNIALRLFGKGEHYPIIHRYNKLGPLPHLLHPGQELRLPLSRSAPDAKIAWVQHDVKTKAPRSLDWRQAQPEMGLWRLYKVVTGDASTAGIIFEDHSKLQMRENALLVIYGREAATSLRRKLFPSDIRVEEGTVKGGLDRLDRGQSLKVQTPSSKITVRSRSIQISVDKEENTAISIFDGQANVHAAGANEVVTKDHGTIIHKGQRPLPPRRLISPPSWHRQGDVIIPVPQGYQSEFEARWRGLPGAAQYRLELALDSQFHFPLVDAIVGAGIKRFRATDLKPGQYFARVSAIDRDQLEGHPSHVLRVHLVPLTTSRRIVRQLEDDRPIFEAVGLLRLNFSLPSNAEVALGKGPYRRASTMRLSRPGDYQIHFRASEQARVSTLQIRLLKVTASLSVDNSSSPPSLRIMLIDPRAYPVNLPGLKLITFSGEELPLLATQAGVYTTVLNPSASTLERWSTTVELRWAGGVLAKKRLVFEASRVFLSQPLAEKPQALGWPGPGAPAEWAPSAFGLPSRSIRPLTFLGLSSFITKANQAGHHPLYLRMALRGGVALLKDTLGFDLDLPWYDGDLTRDQPGENNLGSIRLGSRWWAISIGELHLGPSLRLSLPSGQQALAWRPTTLEPALLLDWDLTPWLTLNSNIVLSIATDFDLTGISLGYSLAGTFQLWQTLRSSIELTSLYALSFSKELGSTSPLILSGGISYDFSRTRLGAVCGVGLTENTQGVFGHFTVGLVYDLLF